MPSQVNLSRFLLLSPWLRSSICTKLIRVRTDKSPRTNISFPRQTLLFHLGRSTKAAIQVYWTKSATQEFVPTHAYMFLVFAASLSRTALGNVSAVSNHAPGVSKKNSRRRATDLQSNHSRIFPYREVHLVQIIARNTDH